MKYAAERPYADPEKAARRILEIANAVEPIQGRIHIEKINEPFLFRDRGSPAEYGAGHRSRLARDARTPEPSSPSRPPAPSCSRDGQDRLATAVRRCHRPARRQAPGNTGRRRALYPETFHSRAASAALAACGRDADQLRRGSRLHARIAMLRALNHGTPAALTRVRKAKTYCSDFSFAARDGHPMSMGHLRALRRP